jgi:hypothetical protein
MVHSILVMDGIRTVAVDYSLIWKVPLATKSVTCVVASPSCRPLQIHVYGSD